MQNRQVIKCLKQHVAGGEEHKPNRKRDINKICILLSLALNDLLLLSRVQCFYWRMVSRRFLLTMLWCGQKSIPSRPWEQDSASTRSKSHSEQKGQGEGRLPQLLLRLYGAEKCDDVSEIVLNTAAAFVDWGHRNHVKTTSNSEF